MWLKPEQIMATPRVKETVKEEKSRKLSRAQSNAPSSFKPDKDVEPW